MLPDSIKLEVLREMLPNGYEIVHAGENAAGEPMDEDQAAAYLKTSVHVLRRHATNGTGPLYRKVGRKRVYFRPELDDWARHLDTYRSPTESRAIG
jgi:hypothetical protein